VNRGAGAGRTANCRASRAGAGESAENGEIYYREPRAKVNQAEKREREYMRRENL